jgi:poly-beta-1,6-N-acetyl-D-glucosamine synthase
MDWPTISSFVCDREWERFKQKFVVFLRERKQGARHQDMYVLMTAAHNEEANIGSTIESVLSQAEIPAKWVIVSDNSDDRTDQIIQSYEKSYHWIKYLRVNRQSGRSFASKVRALQLADRALNNLCFDFIGNIDADVTVGPTYFSTLADRLAADRTLGLAGGFVYEESGGKYVSRRLNSEQSVPHAAQLMRRACYESIGGYAVLRFGGEDWHAMVSAKMNGWHIEAFPDLEIFHQRSSAMTRKMITNSFRAGRMDYSFGCYPPFEVLKCLRRFANAYFTGGIIRMCGFWWGYLIADKRPVSKEFIDFLRKEQKERVISFLKGPIHRKKETLDA